MATRQKILIVDNDAHVAERIALDLEKEFYETSITANLQTVIDSLPSFDLILLHLHPTEMDAMDSVQICRQVRSSSHIPVIILSERSEIFDIVLGLEMGADDFLTLPYDKRELVARIRALLRRSSPQYYGRTSDQKDQKAVSKVVKYPDLCINLMNYSVLCDGMPVDMPPKEIELLYFLASAPEQVFTREQLLNQIWGYDYAGDTRTVDVHIKRLREKLGEHRHWKLSTVWGVGYKFCTL